MGVPGLLSAFWSSPAKAIGKTGVVGADLEEGRCGGVWPYALSASEAKGLDVGDL